ncbi:hypothetical protein ASPFODRAFT_65932 [Aspergillus luchuensis CBS 106.47]|uniref:F-box domain-containing protein n=1 Tax=Aspergillus luchuensis (strain CBS 106.47) TaxID=1137211 RepID=A0A1M3T0E5_ASPLC|nr:hypothetical protein ASPFODRAFT_65932 [Aspergillus luchuensis CBS 106.47]
MIAILDVKTALGWREHILELIILVFQSLNNIDDCLSFSHTCKQFHGVFKRFQIVIFESVIINAKHHEHDIELGLLQDIYERHNIKETFLEPETTYDKVEKPVVSQIKILYDLYRSSSIHSHFVRANTVIHPAMKDRLCDCATEEAMPEPKDFNCTLDYGHRYAEYSRFYHALTAHWVLVAKIWLAKMTHYKKSSTRNDRYNQLWQLWGDNPDRSLREKLDLIEVVDFIWGYLGRNIFKGRFTQLSDWVPQADLAQFTENETPDSAWAFFIARVTQELRPPHIIELLLLFIWNSEMAWRIDRPTSLRQLGFLVEPQSAEEWNDTDWPDTQFSLNILDEDVINSLVDMVGKDTQWQGNMQGRILGYETTSQQLFELIMVSGDV